MTENFNIEELKNILQSEGQTEVDIIVKNKNKKIHYNLKNLRKFDFNHLKLLKSKEYVKKISV